MMDTKKQHATIYVIVPVMKESRSPDAFSETPVASAAPEAFVGKLVFVGFCFAKLAKVFPA
jgi:hypothetical protein